MTFDMTLVLTYLHKHRKKKVRQYQSPYDKHISITIQNMLYSDKKQQQNIDYKG